MGTGWGMLALEIDVFFEKKAVFFAQFGADACTVGDHGKGERIVGGILRLCAERNGWNDAFEGFLDVLDVVFHALDNGVDGDGFVGPAVVIGDLCDGGIGHFGFESEFGFWDSGHADEIGAPCAVEVAFGARRECRPFDADVCALVVCCDALGATGVVEDFAQLGVERIGK